MIQLLINKIRQVEVVPVIAESNNNKEVNNTHLIIRILTTIITAA